ncbi:DUF4334 domain-containing protein [Streptomyces sp. 8K308]|uniref:DUF4334 domain-containing protein n=1 Tax=Streptomyces sp. 8K308 TaxID=2530388 RepID=UPI0010535E49|nr:DUF4334 domain-containing protein [Streptomyces sp. 8K308]TDC26656.1 DUF4334 domain-containing protein [Streptomyces sp. 8K308]
MNIDEARVRFHHLRKRNDGVSSAELDRIWSCLDTVPAMNILGRWKGQGFATGHGLYQRLAAIRWFGKTFNSVTDAKPLICYGENGELFSNVALGGGEASLWNIEFRGEVTATMVYDGRPDLDHFKRVDDTTLMGIMNGKSELVLHNGQHFYFLLERV